MSSKHTVPPGDRVPDTRDSTPHWKAKADRAEKSSAVALDDSVRRPMETRFGMDFGAVRIHADANAADAAHSLGAAAYTVGHNIVFGASRYQPRSSTGQQLLAHELAHVVQQSRGGAAAPDAEARADHAAEQATAGDHVSADALGGAPRAPQAKPDDNPANDPGMTFPVSTLDGFALNGDGLTAAHDADIDQLAFSISLHLGMRRHSRATISIAGHTDRSGDELRNEALGQRRADNARQALVEALKKRGVGADKFGEIRTRSLGETSPLVPTADGVRNAKNRRVEISVDIGSQAPTPAKPEFDATTPLPPGTGEPGTGPRPAPDPGEWWRRAEENQRKVDEFDRKHPHVNKSLSEAVIDKVMDEVVDPLVRKLPVSRKMQDLARTGVRKGLEKGSEAACDAAVDGSGATGAEAEGLKAACKSALKSKAGATTP